MPKDKSMILILIVLIAVLACLASAILMLPERPDNVIQLGGTTFNTTYADDFEEIMVLSDESISDAVYCSDDGKGDYYVEVIDYSGYEDYENISGVNNNTASNIPHQTINGVEVYSGSRISGIPEGKQVYSAYVHNRDLDKIIMFASPDPGETAKMASSVKFNQK